MRRAARSLLFALLAAAATDASACREFPPRAEPTIAELATRADVVAVVHVERILPMDAAEAARLDQLSRNPPLNVTIRYPGPSVQVSLRSPPLKGTLPADGVFRNGFNNCEVILQERGDYVVFATAPETPGGQYLPLHGTFRLDGGADAQARLAQVTSFLNSPTPSTP